MQRLGNQKGQFAIEGILLMVVLVGVFMALSTQLKASGVVTKLVSGPWEKVEGMAEFGSWNPPTNANRALHPIANVRAYSKIQEGGAD